MLDDTKVTAGQTVTAKQLQDMAATALFDTRDSETKELDRFAARQLLAATIEEHLEDANPLIRAHWRQHLLDHRCLYAVNQVVSASKHRLGKTSADDVTVESIRESMYLEVVSWRIPGQRFATTKYLGDCTADELRMVVDTYEEKIDAHTKPRNRYRQIWERMASAEVGEGATVAQVFG